MRHYLASYLPRLMRERLLAADRVPVGPASQRLCGALMLSDMKGFTARVERATNEGSDSVEALNASLQSYFATQIDIITEQGGDVLTFAGDSILSFWQVDDESLLPEAVRQAAHVAWTIQAQLGEEERTRIGIGAGTLVCAYVGGVDGRTEMLLSGPALTEAVDAESRGQEGRVVLSFHAWQHIVQQASGKALEGGLYRLESQLDLQAPQRLLAQVNDALPALTVLQAQAPPSVLHLLQVADGSRLMRDLDDEWLTEVRQISVLMIGLPRISVDTESQLQHAHETILTIQRVTARFDGTVRSALDSKGFTVACYFGLPPHAHAESAVYAGRAAQEIQQELYAKGVQANIGLATGRALCRVFGNARRRGYDLCGAVINRASRLMQTSSADIIGDERTRRLALKRIAFETLPAVSLKGRPGEMAVYRVVGNVPEPESSRPKMVGRRDIHQGLVASLAKLGSHGDGGLILLRGEPGMGKSMLLEELSADAANQPVRVLRGAAESVEYSTPYWAWRAVFRTVVADVGGWQALRDTLAGEDDGPELTRIFPLLSDVIAEDLPSTPFTAELQGETRADNTAVLLRRILEIYACRWPTLILMEDLHWMDSRSLEMLSVLPTQQFPILVVGTMRSGEFDVPGLAPLVGRKETRLVELDRMSDEGIEALCQHLLGCDVLAADLLELVTETVEGNPFFCRELLEALVVKGKIEVREGVCSVRSTDVGDLPDSIGGLILERLDKLEGDEQLFLKSASVYGRRFTLPGLCHALPVEWPSDYVGERLNVPTAVGLLDSDAGAEGMAWLFHHAIVRDVNYGLLTGTQKQQLHLKAASWYESRYGGNPAPVSGIIAHHLECAGDDRRASEYLGLAGQWALRSGAFQESLRLFQRNLELHQQGRIAAEVIQLAEWRKGVGLSSYFLGDLERARVEFEAVVGMLYRPLPVGKGELVRRAFGAASRQVLHLLLRRRDIEKIAAASQDRIDILAECYIKLGQIYFLFGEADIVLLHIAMEGLNIAELAGRTPQLAHILTNAAVISSLIGQRALADAYLQRATAIVKELHQYAGFAYVWHISALIFAQRGAWQRSGEASDQALHYIRELGDRTLEAEACVVRSTASLCQGDIGRAETAWRRGLELARQAGNQQIECWCLLDQAETHWLRDELEQACTALEAALAIPTAEVDGSSSIEKLRVTALVRFDQRRYEESRTACLSLFKMVSAQPPVGYHWAEFHASALDVFLTLLSFAPESTRVADFRIARREVRVLRRLARRFINVRSQALTLAGRLAGLKGDVSQAKRCLSRVISATGEHACRFDQARATLALCQLDPDSCRPAWREDALRLFRELGLCRYERRLRQLDEESVESRVAFEAEAE